MAELNQIFSHKISEIDKNLNDMEYLKNCIKEYKDLDN